MRQTRRTFLRGLGGATFALPWLETFADSAIAPQRAVWFYVPIGVVRRAFFPGEAKAAIPKFTSSRQEIKTEPISVGWHDFPSTPTLEPLAAVKDQVTLITGMDRPFQQGTDVHAQCASCFLSSATPFSVTQSAYPLDRTLDHIIADKIGGDTPFRTLEFSCNSHRDNKESIFFDNISWYGTEHVAPSLRDPRKAYRRLFATNNVAGYRNITDLVLADARELRTQLSYRDREKLGEYFDSVRSIEIQMDRLEAMRSELDKVALEEPSDAYLPRGEYIRLMADLMVAALQTGLTRVATFMVGPERWDTPYKFEGLFDKPRSHHQMSHNQNKFIKDLERVDHFHMQQFAYMLQRMDAVKEADGRSLLDNTLVTYGSGLGDGATHQYNDLPIIFAGGGGRFRTGQYLNCPDGTPLANYWLSIAQAMGLSLDRFADSAAPLNKLRA